MSDDILSDEDRALFRAAVGVVKPLKKNQSILHTKPKPTGHKRTNNSSTQPSVTNTYLSDYIVEEVSSDSILSYSKSGFPHKRMRDLKQGKIPWQARLDLHGLNIDEVSMRLSTFILQNYSQSTRCLLIIHGKGGHDGAPPILKNRINRYLPQFDEVLAFHSALAKDGGTGAVYVLLKRHIGV